mmetsp:Transcript_125324/g.250157  ORF Transcript_125324/g.250157 Transcript_125324/m.250157 type:complete len:224 (+) Transcript_125324:64-735(+)
MVPVLFLLPLFWSGKAAWLCERSSVAVLDFYRYHNVDDYHSLVNRNLGDALGEFNYICQMHDTGLYKHKLLSHWRVSVNTSWGPYAVCNQLLGRRRCWGTLNGHVGRELAIGDTGTGQCTANSRIGSWFSFPEEGQCPNGQDVGFQGCTWGHAQRVRTISAACVLDARGLGQRCNGDTAASIDAATASILVQAFAPSGCRAFAPPHVVDGAPPPPPPPPGQYI